MGVMRSNFGTASRFGAGVDPLGSDQELDVVNIANFGRVH